MKRRAALAVLFIACGTRTTLVSKSVEAPDAGRCPSSLPGPRFVEASWITGCIDATEVTNADYLAFLGDPKHPTGAQLAPALCAPDDRLEPLFDWPPASDRLAYPVVNIDWCGAWAYCEWAGKRLCTTSQYTTSCEGLHGSAYPYGSAYSPRACNGLDYDAGRALPAGSLPTCEGPPGAYDMSGNVWEWLSDYNPNLDGGPQVGLGGGGFRNDRYNLRCDAFFTAPPTYRYDYYGFRCCSR